MHELVFVDYDSNINFKIGSKEKALNLHLDTHGIVEQTLAPLLLHTASQSCIRRSCSTRLHRIPNQIQIPAQPVRQGPAARHQYNARVRAAATSIAPLLLKSIVVGMTVVQEAMAEAQVAAMRSVLSQLWLPLMGLQSEVDVVEQVLMLEVVARSAACWRTSRRRTSGRCAKTSWRR